MVPVPPVTRMGAVMVWFLHCHKHCHDRAFSLVVVMTIDSKEM
jgi:hypothetical protein